MAQIKKILIVDDDVSFINLLQGYLPKVIKYELYTVLNGIEALRILEEKNPDVVLLDMQLPGMQGTQILEVIRQKYPKTKVLVVTSYDKEVKEAVGKLGVDGFFPKPVVLNELIQRIREVLETEENTTVTPIALDDIQKKEGVEPKAKILFIEKEFWMPYLLPIADEDREEDYPLERYGEFEFKTVYCQKAALSALAAFKPDIVICATDVPVDEPLDSKSVSTADLIPGILKSKYAPKAVIIHGPQRSIDSSSFEKIADNASAWVEKEDMYNYDEEKDKENAMRLNKMLWYICFKHGLVKKRIEP